LIEQGRIGRKPQEGAVSPLSSALRFAAVAPALALAACAAPPWTVASAPAAIALRWYPQATPHSRADQLAELHCARSDKTAEMVLDNRDGSAEYAEYRCR
jgi:hypothetical protein